MLRYILQYHRLNGWSPSIREIADHELFASTGHCQMVLRHLEKRGDVRLGNGARCIDIRPALAKQERR
jgi:SOS-response transcriptional repressor LexA